MWLGELLAVAGLDPALQAQVVALILDPGVRDEQNVAQALLAIDEGRTRERWNARAADVARVPRASGGWRRWCRR